VVTSPPLPGSYASPLPNLTCAAGLYTLRVTRVNLGVHFYAEVSATVAARVL
jgi:hypothetical protein